MKFKIIESFKGSPTPTLTWVLPFNSEQFNFQERTRLLVYANSWQDKWMVGSCGRTREVRPDDKEVASLEKLTRGEPGGDVSGWFQQPPTGPGPFLEPEIVVRLRDEKSTEIQEVTGTTGFDFGWLSPGRYVLEIEKPGPLGRHEVLVTATSRCVFLPDLALNLR